MEEQKEKTYKRTLTMYDDQRVRIEATESMMRSYFEAIGEVRLIDADPKRMFANYIHVAKKRYRKEHPKPKSDKVGGKREGAGRKAKSGGSFHHGFRLSERSHNILLKLRELGVDMTTFVDEAIIEKFQAESMM